MASAPLTPTGERVVALSWGDLNPLNWLGSAASQAASDAWQAAMTALWSAGLWVLGLAFKIIDAFTTPDLSTTGPLAEVLPYTFALGGLLAGLMALTQIGVALFKRDGQSVARVLVGAVQFGLVWVGYIAVAAVLVEATAGLTRGLLEGLLNISDFADFSTATSWPRNIDDTVVATVLGLCTVFIVFPAAIGYILIMLVREAALLLLTATSPIAAGGLVAETTRTWFWKSLRWFIATLLIAPMAALVLGVGVKITQGTVEGSGDKTAAAVGMAVTGCILILIGALCPLVLFRLLAFVDPGTSSGAALRESMAANGGLAGLLSGASTGRGGGSASAGSGAASQQDGAGRSGGEAAAATQTASRFGGMLVGQAIGAGMHAATTIGSKAAAIGSDVLGAAGVGHQAPYVPTASDNSPSSRPQPTPAAGGGNPADSGAPDATGNTQNTGATGCLRTPAATPDSLTQPAGAAAGSTPAAAAGGVGGAGIAGEVPIVPL